MTNPPQPTEQDDLAYCMDLVRDADRDRYLTVLLAPARSRAALFVLYAFKVEVEKTHAVVSEPMLGQIRLQWWRESLDGIYAGAPRRHAVVTPLADLVQRHGLDRALFDRIIDGHERDLDPAPFESLEALVGYCIEVEGALIALAMTVLAGRPECERLALAETAGAAFGMARLLRRMALNRPSGPLPVPASIAVANGLEPEALRNVGRDSVQLQAAVAEVAGETAHRIVEAQAASGAALPADRSALLPLAVARGILRRLKKAKYAPFDARVVEPAPGEIWRLLLASVLRRP